MSDSEDKPRYILRPVTTPIAKNNTGEKPQPKKPLAPDPFLRPAQEDDDGYDPYSDRPPAPEPPFQENPWR